MPGRSMERERFYLDMLGSGSTDVGYWADVEDIRIRGKYDIVSYDLTETGDGEESNNLGRVNVETIAKGWQLLRKLEATGRFSHCGESRSVRNTETELAKGEWGDPDYDACVADAVIQLATLGELRYG